jgi:hypothetical protein
MEESKRTKPHEPPRRSSLRFPNQHRQVRVGRLERGVGLGDEGAVDRSAFDDRRR